MGWNHLNFTNEQEVRNAISDLTTVVSRTRTGEPLILGTAFPIYASEKHVLMVTAAHLVEHGYRESSRACEAKDRRRLNHIPAPENEPFESMAKWVSETSDLWCLYGVGHKVVQCAVTGACLRPPLDIALLVMDATPLGQESRAIFQINSDVLNVGDGLVVVSFITEGLSRKLIGRHGQIKAFKSSGTLANAPIYETNIPIEAGASGGPIFRYLGHFNGPKEVIGVVSSDCSDPEAFEDCHIDGESRISIIGSAAPLQVNEKEDGVMTFQDMCRKGLIRDSGTCMNDLILTYHADGNWEQKIPVRKSKTG